MPTINKRVDLPINVAQPCHIMAVAYWSTKRVALRACQPRGRATQAYELFTSKYVSPRSKH
jgi:hypothetical protein